MDLVNPFHPCTALKMELPYYSYDGAVEDLLLADSSIVASDDNHAAHTYTKKKKKRKHKKTPKQNKNKTNKIKRSNCVLCVTGWKWDNEKRLFTNTMVFWNVVGPKAESRAEAHAHNNTGM